MSRVITMPDGTIIFPRKGMPPVEVNGYEPDLGDPYIFHPVWKPCKYRMMRELKLPCGKIRTVPCCELKQIVNLDRLYCEQCSDAKEDA